MLGSSELSFSSEDVQNIVDLSTNSTRRINMFKINMFKHVSTCEKSAYKHIVWTYGKLLVGYNENYMISMISI